jgi:hypothetical protein
MRGLPNLAPQLRKSKSLSRRHIPQSFVRWFLMIIPQELADDVVQVRLANNDKMVQAFLLDRLDEPFDIGIQVGRYRDQSVRAQPVSDPKPESSRRVRLAPTTETVAEF